MIADLLRERKPSFQEIAKLLTTPYLDNTVTLFAGFLFFLIQQTILIGADKHGYGGKLFRFEAHGLASVGEIFLPRDIIIFTFMTIDKCLHNL
jgi:hypothetical protein